MRVYGEDLTCQGLGYPGSAAISTDGDCRKVNFGGGEIIVEPPESDMLRKTGGEVLLVAGGGAVPPEDISMAVAAQAEYEISN